jgi:hypothetical protein
LREIGERFSIIDLMRDCLEDLKSPAHTKHAWLPMRQYGFEMRIGFKPSLGARGPENLVVTETAIDAA